jgi:SAM-dependent methyltransferase
VLRLDEVSEGDRPLVETRSADELTVSYDNRFRDAIERGESIYEPMPPLQQAAHERRMELLDALPVGDLSGKVCVDFGVGSWGFACVYPRLQHCGFAVGIDISQEAVKESAKVSASGNFAYGERYAYLTSAGDDIRLRDGTVDLFFAGECIEHVENTDAFLDEIHRVLAPGGLLVLTTPNADSYLYRIRGERWCIGPEHVSLMNLDEFRRYLEPGFEILEMKGFAASVHRSLDDAITDPDFARSWVGQFEDQPHLASALVALARRRDSYQPSRCQQWRFHHQHDDIEYTGSWQVATLHESLSGRLAPGGPASLRLTVPGTDVLVFLWAHDWSGHAVVRVDEVEQPVDLYSAQGGFLRLHFAGLPDGLHQLEVRGTGGRDPRSHADQVLFHQAISYRRRPGP